MSINRRTIPAVDKILNSPLVKEVLTKYPHDIVVDVIRETLNNIRDGEVVLMDFDETSAEESIANKVVERLQFISSSTIHEVINATGVILHTNLGRAPLSKQAQRAMFGVSEGYSNLEFDVREGNRGSRYIHTEELLKRLSGAEAALVVNNNASAVLLVLSTFAKKRRVLIARSQLIEIGGGFRIPEVMKQSGAILEEIGTTNRVHISDYKDALRELPIKLVMRAHRSNFSMHGFIHEPELSEIVDTAHNHNIMVYDDLGSGTLLDTTQYGLAYEPTIMDSINAGVDLVSFSGDKLLGGPQAGILVGKGKFIEKMKKNPFTRALRVDKTCLAALSETLIHYLRGEAESYVPIWRMIGMDIEKIKSRVESWVNECGFGELTESTSAIGGGSLPDSTLDTYVFSYGDRNPQRLQKALRRLPIPIISRIEEGNLLLDPRTISEEHDDYVVESLIEVITNT